MVNLLVSIEIIGLFLYNTKRFLFKRKVNAN